ncbi:hypothetical protein DFAR_1260048 [Desulfarculales bacterium]
MLINGSTGGGKSSLACALSHKTYLEGYSVSYKRVPALLREIVAALGESTVAIKR